MTDLYDDDDAVGDALDLLLVLSQL